MRRAGLGLSRRRPPSASAAEQGNGEGGASRRMGRLSTVPARGPRADLAAFGHRARAGLQTEARKSSSMGRPSPSTSSSPAAAWRGWAWARAGPACFANDFDPMKAATYRANFGERRTCIEGDVWALAAADLPGHADLAWASSPCQDLSLAGAPGRAGRRPLLGLLGLLAADAGPGRRGPRARAPSSSRTSPACSPRTAARDFAAVWRGAGRPRLPLRRAGDRRGGASCRSRGRACSSSPPASRRRRPGRRQPFHTRAVAPAAAGLPAALQARWIWWRLPAPPRAQHRPRRSARARRGGRLAHAGADRRAGWS